uniref:Uncharacterized protein n=1 Tax=Anguilla anguilla TaxID=7936 RepID=A0A0E9VLW2_ANGAN
MKTYFDWLQHDSFYLSHSKQLENVSLHTSH